MGLGSRPATRLTQVGGHDTWHAGWFPRHAPRAPVQHPRRRSNARCTRRSNIGQGRRYNTRPSARSNTTSRPRGARNGRWRRAGAYASASFALAASAEAYAPIEPLAESSLRVRSPRVARPSLPAWLPNFPCAGLSSTSTRPTTTSTASCGGTSTTTSVAARSGRSRPWTQGSGRSDASSRPSSPCARRGRRLRHICALPTRRRPTGGSSGMARLVDVGEAAWPAAEHLVVCRLRHGSADGPRVRHTHGTDAPTCAHRNVRSGVGGDLASACLGHRCPTHPRRSSRRTDRRGVGPLLEGLAVDQDVATCVHRRAAHGHPARAGRSCHGVAVGDHAMGAGAACGAGAGRR